MASLKVKEIFCIVYSGLLFISGLLLIAFSVLLCYRTFHHFTFTPSSTLSPLVSIFVLGILHLFLTWLGINGPTREHNFHIVLFMVFTLILLICEFAVGVWAIVLWSEVSVLSVDLQSKTFVDMVENCKVKSWIKLQHEFECCGLHGISDYSKDDCKSSCLDHEVLNGTVQFYYENGCQKPFAKYVKNILFKGALIGFLSGLYQAFGIFLYCTFFQTLREERKDRIARVSVRQRTHSQSCGQYLPGAETPLVQSIRPLANPPSAAPPPGSSSPPIASSPPPLPTCTSSPQPPSSPATAV